MQAPRVRNPNHWNRVFLKRPVHPGLALLSGASAADKTFSVDKYVFNLVEQDKHPPLGKETLRHTERTETLLAVDGVSFAIIARDLNQLTVQLFSDDLCELGFYCPKLPIQENVHPFAPFGNRLLEIEVQKF